MKSFYLKFTIALLLLICNIDYANASITSGGASASTSTPDNATMVICNVVKALSGPLSQGIATLVIIITGYSFFVGKVSIGMLMIVAAGIIFVFGAQTILGWILGDNSLKCSGGKVGS